MVTAAEQRWIRLYHPVAVILFTLSPPDWPDPLSEQLSGFILCLSLWMLLVKRKAEKGEQVTADLIKQ